MPAEFINLHSAAQSPSLSLTHKRLSWIYKNNEISQLTWETHINTKNPVQNKLADIKQRRTANKAILHCLQVPQQLYLYWLSLSNHCHGSPYFVLQQLEDCFVCCYTRFTEAAQQNSG